MKLYKHKNYKEYVEAQIKKNKNKLNKVWIQPKELSSIVSHIKANISNPEFGLCHGVRNAWEVRKFKKALEIKIIGTEISPTAEQFEDVIQWDFHDVKDSWIGSVDFIYSNSWDHSYEPKKCLDRWMKCLKEGGICYIHWRASSKLDAADCSVMSIAECKNLFSKKYDVVGEFSPIKGRKIFAIMNRQKVDIAMTAVLRPSLLDETLTTITKNVVDIPERFRLIINVDPVGEDIDSEQVIDVAKKHFKNVIYNIPMKPSFPKAVKWVWSHTDAPYVFHWEDDSFIFRKIDILDMIKIHRIYPDVASLRLFKFNTPNKKIISAFGTKWHYHGEGLYISQRWQEQFGLNPNLIKREFVQEAVSRMCDDINPEKQFRHWNDWMVPLIRKWDYALYTKPGDKAIVWGKKGDLWKKKHGLKKNMKKPDKFITWDKIK
jgi:hypothetical protein